MHDTQYVLEPHVLCGWEHKPRGLQLVDLSKALHPRMIDDVLLGDFARVNSGSRCERDIPMDWVVGQAFRSEVTHRAASVYWPPVLSAAADGLLTGRVKSILSQAVFHVQNLAVGDVVAEVLEPVQLPDHAFCLWFDLD